MDLDLCRLSKSNEVSVVFHAVSDKHSHLKWNVRFRKSFLRTIEDSLQRVNLDTEVQKRRSGGGHHV